LGYLPKEDKMKAAIAAIALSAVAVAAPIGAAQAHTTVTVGIETPAFGVRFGAPYVSVAPVYPAPVYVPAPVYAPAPPVVYVPPRVVVRPPVIYPVVYPYGPPVVKHPRHHHPHRVIVPGGYAYGRY
jgi:hypothetical protein